MLDVRNFSFVVCNNPLPSPFPFPLSHTDHIKPGVVKVKELVLEGLEEEQQNDGAKMQPPTKPLQVAQEMEKEMETPQWAPLGCQPEVAVAEEVA